MKNRYLITVTTDARWTDPDEIHGTCYGDTLREECKSAAENHANEDGATVAVWLLTPVEVQATVFEVTNLPEDARLPKKPVTKKRKR